MSWIYKLLNLSMSLAMLTNPKVGRRYSKANGAEECYNKKKCKEKQDCRIEWQEVDVT